MLPFRKILCPTDFSEPSYEAIKVASELASHFAAEILLLHVVTPVSVSPEVMLVPPVTVPVSEQELEAPAKQSLEEMVGQLHLQGLRARFIILRGDAADEIIQTADRENVELISIATRGRTGLARLFFGSVAEKVVRLARCPVLTIAGRPPGGVGEEPSPEQEELKTKEEKSAEKKTYQEKVEAQMREWRTKIDEMKAQAEKVKADVIMGYEEKIGELRAKEEAVRQKMLEIRNVGEGAWEGFKGDMEKSLDSLRDDLERVLAKLKETISEMDEKVSREKEAYGRKVEDQLRKWGEKIETLKAKAESSKTEAKTVYLNQIEELRRKQEAARKKLQDFKESGDKAWEDLRGGLDQVLEDLKKSLKQAVSRFREK